MARPMYLIKRELLEELYYKAGEGIPLAKLIRQYDLGIAAPTLRKLLDYVMAADEAKTDEAGNLIEASLYPEWLTTNETDANIVLQPPEWRYEGKMPLGKWVKNEWAHVKDDISKSTAGASE